MLRKSVTGLILLALLMPNAQSATTSVTVTGWHSNSENGCTAVTPAFSGQDCSYDASNPTGLVTTEWTGPAFFAGYYSASIGSARPAPGDGKIAPGLAGSMAIDDQGTLSALDDTIALSLTVGGVGARSFPIGNGIDVGEESWQSMTIDLSPTTVTSGNANAFGGTTYSIGNFPELLIAPGGETFTSEAAPLETAGGSFWTQPGESGIATFEVGAGGATAGMNFSGYSCVDSAGAGACASDWALGNLGDIDSFLMTIATNSLGSIVSGQAIWVQEFDLVFGQPDSYTASVLTFSSVVPLPGGAWLFCSAMGFLAWFNRRRP